MDKSKLVPWNWFRKEQEQQAGNLPAARVPVRGWYASPLAQMHREMDRMFDELLQGFGVPPLSLNRPFASPEKWLRPTLDIAATDKEYAVSVELPGVDKDDVRVEVADETLCIFGRKEQKKEDKQKDYYRMERSYGSFQRVLHLPEDADPEGIKANFKNGVMKLSIPRKQSEKARSRQIEVTAE
ncbi:MAG: Hsp20/alpha crystallin family protein [Deltaproteobacteria bacterium]|nr:Hsp20/alpha crystallin family protein [Deltaproteobacteria bacterium]